MFLPVASTELWRQRCCLDHPVLSREMPGSQGWPKKDPAFSNRPGYPTAGTFPPEPCCLTCGRGHHRPGQVWTAAGSCHICRMPRRSRVPHAFAVCSPQPSISAWSQGTTALPMARTTSASTFKPKLWDKPSSFRAPIPITGEASSVQDTGTGIPGHQGASL